MSKYPHCVLLKQLTFYYYLVKKIDFFAGNEIVKKVIKTS